ncbi:zinc transporter 1-like protein [Dinothrombium tinctorium]|uniref:Zinc transporter 1-like protein n=1 Tax=Dinothrombium tinctorium TaxID=1965070 RepID=A0A3S4R448_9ACAR|nr:zinc transporter 1-like protein [Dinothrombium tinctorium]
MDKRREKEQIKNIRRLKLMLILTTSYMLVEMSVGYATKAISLVTDSFHMLSDVVSLVIAFICIKISMKKWSRNTYGWARAEILGSLINAVFLCALCFSIFIEAIKRFTTPEAIERPDLVLYVASFGLCVNVFGLFLFKHGKSIKRQHQKAETQLDIRHQVEEEEYNSSQMNIRGVFIHILADAIGSVIVMASACLALFTNWKFKLYVDPSLSLASVLLILISTWTLLRNSSLILLQTMPSHIDVELLKNEIKQKIPQVLEIHELHIWQLTGDTFIATAHILCKNTTSFMQIVGEMKSIFHAHKIHSTTIQPEFVENDKNLTQTNKCLVPCLPKDQSETCCKK